MFFKKVQNYRQDIMKILLHLQIIKSFKKLQLFLLLLLFYNFFIIFSFANPIDDIPKEKEVFPELEIIEGQLSELSLRLNQNEDRKYKFLAETLIASFGYNGDRPEEIICPLDYYNIRPVVSGFAFSNRFLFTLKERLNYDLSADIKLESYNFSGSREIATFWGSPLPYRYFAESNLIFGHVELKARNPDISCSIGNFYPASFSDLIYSSPLNLSVYGPDKLPSRGLRMGASIYPLSLELIWGIDSCPYNNIFMKEDTFLWGGRGGLFLKPVNIGLTFIQAKRTFLQDTLALDLSSELTESLSLKGEFSRSFFEEKNEGGSAFRVSLEKRWGKFILGGQYIWVSPSYDPLGLHENFTQRELLGISRLANNRQGLDTYILFPWDRGEIKCELMHFTQILPSKLANTKGIFLDPLFPVSIGENLSSGTFTAFQFSLNKNIGSYTFIKGKFELVKLYRPSIYYNIDFTQTTCLIEAEVQPLNSFSIGCGLIYVKRYGDWFTYNNSCQFTPLFKSELEINKTLSVSFEYRNLMAFDERDSMNNFNFNQAIVRTRINF